MSRTILTMSVALLAAAGASAQSDEQLLETVRTSAIAVFLEQAPWVLPDSFHNSDLTEPDKEKVILQLAHATADCFSYSVIEYATRYDVPISDFVSSDGTIHFNGDTGRPFSQLLEPCIENAWQVAGVRLE
jgi:hypothetical protein